MRNRTKLVKCSSANERIRIESIMRVVELPNGITVPAELVEAAMCTLKQLAQADGCWFDALVRVCRTPLEGKPCFGMQNCRYILQVLGYIDTNGVPYPLIRDVVLLCVKGEEFGKMELEYPEIKDPWKEAGL
jgi:hypothetical protein